MSRSKSSVADGSSAASAGSTSSSTPSPSGTGLNGLSARAQELLDESFLNEEHIASFEEALGYSDLMPDTSDPTPHSPRSPQASSSVVGGGSSSASVPQSPVQLTTQRVGLPQQPSSSSSNHEGEDAHGAAGGGSSSVEAGPSSSSSATATRRRGNRLGSSMTPNVNASGGSGGGSALGRSPSSQTIASQGGGAGGGWEKVEKVKALSDFAPVHQRVAPLRRGNGSTSGGGGGGSGNGGGGGTTRMRRRRAASSGASGWSYQIGRWPLLGFIFLVIFLEFLIYVLVRQVVNAWEAFVGVTGSRRKRLLTTRLRTAQSWEEWKEAAAEMDDFLGFNEWKENDEAREYDWPLVRKVRRSLVHLRKINDVRGLMGVLEICLRNNFAGTEGMRIYSEAFIGTKKSIENYVDEVKESLDFVLASKDISLEEKRRFYRAVNKNYGSSALCLSGGASFGYYHFGVVRAFLDADLMPRVVTGTSAGGLVAALVCTRTDDELKELLVPELADKLTACEDSILVWLRRFIRTGARFDTLQWARKATFWTRGSMTFREAYERTGRALNVSVVPHDRHSPTKLLNYLTAPDCVIWSAIIASAAVPGILNAVVLMQKTPDGSLRPMNWGSKFKDGSLRVDIPLESLHLLFNVNYSIVSQVNPHVHLFFFAPRGSVGKPVAHRKGKGWRGGFVLAAVEQYLKLELKKNFRVIRDLEHWSSVFLQRFEGTVNIIPTSRILDWFHLLTDPDRAEMKRLLRVGQEVTWPKLHMIENRLKIERSVLRGRYEVRQAMHQDRTTTDREPQRPAERAASQFHIPFESDVETGFASRSKSRKHVPKQGGQDGSRDYFNSKRRKQFQPTSTGFHAEASSRLREEVESMLPVTDGEDDEGEEALHTPPLAMPDRAMSEQPATGYATLGSSFTRLRTRSFPGFPSGLSSLGLRPAANQLATHSEESAQTEGADGDAPAANASGVASHPATPSRSRLSRWLLPRAEDLDAAETPDEQVFDDTPAEDEEDEQGDSEVEIAGRAIEAEDILGQDQDISGESDDEDDELLGVSGEPVSKRQIREAAAAGER